MLSARRSLSNQLLRILGTRSISLPPNEPPTDLSKGSPELVRLKEEVQRVQNETLEIPCIVNGKEIYTGNTKDQFAPYNHSLKVAKFHLATEEVINDAINAGMAARKEWERMPFEHRHAIFNKVADLLSGKYRTQVLAATIVGQGKTAFEADIDAVQELVDFFRFSGHYGEELHQGMELHQPRGQINRVIYRGLEGFVAAISPFNFTAIGGNLSGTPALMGNVVLWKPAGTAVLSCYLVQKIFKEAGLPDGVVNFVPSTGPTFGGSITKSPHLTAINFTGSVQTFNTVWKNVANNIDSYRSYPRLVGECGGKNYHFVHPSADVDRVVDATIRAAFGYGGQKCSACSRLYVPQSLWEQVKEGLIEQHRQIKVGSPEHYDTFVSAVIDEQLLAFKLHSGPSHKPGAHYQERPPGGIYSFDNIKSYIDYAKASPDLKIIAGGNCNKSIGYFVEPTIIEADDPRDKLMEEEIFGPVLTVHVYPDNKCSEMLELVDQTSPYGLTGAIFSRDRKFIVDASEALKDSAGNFYINDRSTGSVVAQQPFGGARMSGTNDKAGSSHYLLKWVSMQSIKESTGDMATWKYPHQS